MARGKGLGSYQLKESATPSEATLFRMLQCIPGVSAAKAAAVIEHYHSVSELVEAYESLESEEEKEKLLIVGVKWEVECRINWEAIRANGFFRNESIHVFAVFQISWISNKTISVFVEKTEDDKPFNRRITRDNSSVARFTSYTSHYSSSITLSTMILRLLDLD